jgi:hypothetical protein
LVRQNLVATNSTESTTGGKIVFGTSEFSSNKFHIKHNRGSNRARLEYRVYK